MPRLYKLRISIEPQAMIGVVILMLTIPIHWLSAWLIAAAVHELFHCVGVYLCGGRIYNIRIGLYGAKIETSSLSRGKEILCLLLGPLGSLSLLTLSSHYPRLSVCAALQSAYNLLPLPNLDGGQALHRILQILFPAPYSQKICKIIQYVTMTAIIMLCIYCSVQWKLGILPILLAVIFLMRYGQIKIPCKHGNYRVQ